MSRLCVLIIEDDALIRPDMPREQWAENIKPLAARFETIPGRQDQEGGLS
jgi:hypothetical protein